MDPRNKVRNGHQSSDYLWCRTSSINANQIMCSSASEHLYKRWGDWFILPIVPHPNSRYSIHSKTLFPNSLRPFKSQFDPSPCPFSSQALLHSSYQFKHLDNLLIACEIPKYVKTDYCVFARPSTVQLLSKNSELLLLPSPSLPKLCLHLFSSNIKMPCRSYNQEVRECRKHNRFILQGPHPAAFHCSAGSEKPVHC